MQRGNENALQVQENLEKEVTGGISSYSDIRTVLSLVAIAYDLTRRLSVQDIKFLYTSENGKVILRFVVGIQKMLRDDGMYLWRDLDLGIEAGEITTVDEVPSEIYLKIREQVLEKLNDGDIPDHIIVPLREQIKEDYLSDACHTACEAARGVLVSLEGFDPFEVDNRLGHAAQTVELLTQNFEALKEHVERELGALEENITDVTSYVNDAKDYVPSDGIDFDYIATDVGNEIETAIEGM